MCTLIASLSGILIHHLLKVISEQITKTIFIDLGFQLWYVVLNEHSMVSFAYVLTKVMISSLRYHFYVGIIQTIAVLLKMFKKELFE